MPDRWEGSPGFHRDGFMWCEAQSRNRRLFLLFPGDVASENRLAPLTYSVAVVGIQSVKITTISACACECQLYSPEIVQLGFEFLEKCVCLDGKTGGFLTFVEKFVILDTWSSTHNLNILEATQTVPLDCAP